ncbi:hypothetical protein PoB_002484300 [Plakobranchus ocellatus]|uniref:Uncharacterized protein n=1 Tax=Plakobranchus ocellatus TaxID=259542 RepID=A0AAV3ZV96_9GAST|nr:hypothetical protein PoB_002484300 [Plakobranchus ocellatus]
MSHMMRGVAYSATNCGQSSIPEHAWGCRRLLQRTQTHSLSKEDFLGMRMGHKDRNSSRQLHWVFWGIWERHLKHTRHCGLPPQHMVQMEVTVQHINDPGPICLCHLRRILGQHSCI